MRALCRAHRVLVSAAWFLEGQLSRDVPLGADLQLGPQHWVGEERGLTPVQGWRVVSALLLTLPSGLSGQDGS